MWGEGRGEVGDVKRGLGTLAQIHPPTPSPAPTGHAECGPGPGHTLSRDLSADPAQVAS